MERAVNRMECPAVCFGVALTAFGLAAAPVAADDTLAARIDPVVEAWTGDGRVVGTVVMVARDGDIVYRRAAGFADREARTPVREDTIFRFASMSKLVVSATALALVDDGRLSLDDPVSDWLDGFAPAGPDGEAATITVRQLMTHTSGLVYGFMLEGEDPYAAAGIGQGLTLTGRTLDDTVRALSDIPLFFEPGTQWHYSVSTDVLGAVVEEAAGMPLEAAVERYVTGPLGMTDTAFGVHDADRLAVAYRDDVQPPVPMAPTGDAIPLGAGIPADPARALSSRAYPSGGAGMSGTAPDYLALLEALRKGGSPVLSERSAAALATHAIGDLRAWTEGEGWGFSLGAAVLVDPDAAGVQHSAGTWQWGGVYGGHWFVDPAEKLSVVVLTNTTSIGLVGAFRDELRQAIYED